jgi:hypothetical protein
MGKKYKAAVPTSSKHSHAHSISPGRFPRGGGHSFAAHSVPSGFRSGAAEPAYAAQSRHESSTNDDNNNNTGDDDDDDGEFQIPSARNRARPTSSSGKRKLVSFPGVILMNSLSDVNQSIRVAVIGFYRVLSHLGYLSNRFLCENQRFLTGMFVLLRRKAFRLQPTALHVSLSSTTNSHIFLVMSEIIGMSSILTNATSSIATT